MKKMKFLLFAAVLFAAYSCKRTDEVNPVQQTVDHPNDSLKNQNVGYLIPTVIAGRSDHPGNANGTGSTARFNSPRGIFTKSDGSLLVADYGNNAIRKISTTNVVTTPYRLTDSPSDVAALKDGAVGVVTNGHLVIFNHGTHVSLTLNCGLCDFADIDKDPSSTFFWYGRGWIYDGSALLSTNETLSAAPFPRITLSSDENILTAFSVAANDNKFFTTFDQVFERTHGGHTFPIFSGFTGIAAIIANHDGTKLYIADDNGITLIDRCPTCVPVETLLLPATPVYGLALSNDEKVLYFTSFDHHTVNKVVLK